MSTKNRAWRKSSRSANQGNCLEVCTDQEILIRDSKLGEHSPIIGVSAGDWTSFLATIKH